MSKGHYTRKLIPIVHELILVDLYHKKVGINCDYLLEIHLTRVKIHCMTPNRLSFQDYSLILKLCNVRHPHISAVWVPLIKLNTVRMVKNKEDD